MELLDVQKIVPNSENWIEIKPLDRGNSPDKKFCVKDTSGKKYVLRLSKEEEYEHKKEIFDRMKIAYSTKIPMTEPVDFGKASDGTVYSLFSWLEGVDADTYLNDLSVDAQYAFGVEIGKIQKKIHAFSPNESESFDWYEKITEEMKEVFGWYENSGLTVEHADEIISCVKENLDLMKDRPVTLTHGDYQISNFLIMPDGHAGIIDFDYIRYTDPMQETQALTIYTRAANIASAVGQIDGYCDNAPTPEFFQIMKFYNAYNLLSGLYWWATTHGERGIALFSDIMKLCCADYDNYKLDVPTWYTEWKNK